MDAKQLTSTNLSGGVMRGGGLSGGRRRDGDTNLGHAVMTVGGGGRVGRRQRPTVLTALRETTAVAEAASADRAILPVCGDVSAAVWRWPGGPQAAAAASAVNQARLNGETSGSGMILYTEPSSEGATGAHWRGLRFSSG
ncbi:hypothetical protein ACI65C_009181 [Semiaphis heraclei]